MPIASPVSIPRLLDEMLYTFLRLQLYLAIADLLGNIFIKICNFMRPETATLTLNYSQGYLQLRQAVCSWFPAKASLVDHGS